MLHDYSRAVLVLLALVAWWALCFGALLVWATVSRLGYWLRRR